MPKDSIASQLERARRVLSVIETDAELKARLAALGYTETRLNEGQTLYAAALDSRTATHAAHGDQLGATDTVEGLRDTVEAQVSTLSQMARVVFAGNNDALETLGLRMAERATPETAPAAAPAAGETSPAPRRASRSQAALLDRARTLYDGALGDPALLAALADVGYTQVRLTNERAQVAALENADTTQESNKAGAKARTASQSAALEALDDWLARLRGVAKAGLRDRRDLLDKLDI